MSVLSCKDENTLRRCSVDLPPLLVERSEVGRGEWRWCLLSVEVLWSALSPPVKLSDSGRSGSQAGLAPASAATQPASLHARDSASDTADLGAAGMPRYLQCLQGKLEWLLTNHSRSYDAAGSKAQQCASPHFVQCP